MRSSSRGSCHAALQRVRLWPLTRVRRQGRARVLTGRVLWARPSRAKATIERIERVHAALHVQSSSLALSSPPEPCGALLAYPRACPSRCRAPCRAPPPGAAPASPAAPPPQRRASPARAASRPRAARPAVRGGPPAAPQAAAAPEAGPAPPPPLRRAATQDMENARQSDMIDMHTAMGTHESADPDGAEVKSFGHQQCVLHGASRLHERIPLAARGAEAALAALHSSGEHQHRRRARQPVLSTGVRRRQRSAHARPAAHPLHVVRAGAVPPHAGAQALERRADISDGGNNDDAHHRMCAPAASSQRLAWHRASTVSSPATRKISSGKRAPAEGVVRPLDAEPGASGGCVSP